MEVARPGFLCMGLFSSQGCCPPTHLRTQSCSDSLSYFQAQSRQSKAVGLPHVLQGAHLKSTLV